MKNTDIYKYYTKQLYKMNGLISRLNQSIESVAGITEEDVNWNDCGRLSYIIEKLTEVVEITEGKS